MALYSAASQGVIARPKAERRRPAALLVPLLAGAIMVGAPAPPRADCMPDIRGRIVCDRGQCAGDLHGSVFCSRYEDGAALRTRKGEVVCGKGACVITIEGEIICSARPGGAAMMDLRGKVVCEGGCEPASANFCGQTPGSP